MKIAKGIPSRLNHRKTAALRSLVQAGFTLFCLWAGYRFYLFYLWALGQTDSFVPRPPSVEAFLPISALVGLKRLVLTGSYDMVHPAGLTILLSALLIAFLFRKGFCGWICPVGFVSNLAERGGRHLRLTFRLPVWLDLPLLSLKYLLLAFFVYLILYRMTLAQIEAFHQTPYNLAADAKMLVFFLSPSGLALGVMIFLVVISFFIRNFWCRYLCPYGAMLGLFALAPFTAVIKRKPESCIDCKRCEKVCPASIKITGKKSLKTPECVGCTECIAACPIDDCLTLTAGGRKKVPPLVLPLLILLTFFLCWFTALVTGYWHTEVPPEVFKQVYSRVAELPHPGIK